MIHKNPSISDTNITAPQISEEKTLILLERLYQSS
jgi:hypothetical protein